MMRIYPDKTKRLGSTLQNLPRATTKKPRAKSSDAATRRHRALAGMAAMMTLAHWFTRCECGGFPVERAALCSCDLSVLHVGGEWQWLVRQAGRDVAEGAARTDVDARHQAEAVALKLG
jgi:hypothetical protein